MRYELADTTKAPLAIKTDFRTDNLRWGPDGKLLLAGPGVDPEYEGDPTAAAAETPGSVRARRRISS